MLYVCQGAAAAFKFCSNSFRILPTTNETERKRALLLHDTDGVTGQSYVAGTGLNTKDTRTVQDTCNENRKMVSVRLHAVIFMTLAFSTTWSCPRKCQCIWRDSKITVDCSDQNLAAIPTTVEANTQVLNISGNAVPLFGRRHFVRLGLINLQRVSAARCSLVQIDGLAFAGLSNLVELDLALNGLIEIPSDALNSGDGAVSLMSLSLRGNPVEAVRTRAFHRLAQLTKLDLSECKISAIESGAFEGLKSLQRFYLHSNRLVTLSARDLPPSLHGISVHENRWTCDCRLRSFRLWLTQSNVPRIVEPVCQGPRRLLGIHIQSLSLAEFACAPQLSPTSMYLTVPKGKNVSIVCRVASDPVSKIAWFFNGQQIHNDDEDDARRRNAFLPRASERLPSDLAPKLEHERHFRQPGRIRVIRQEDVTGTGETRSELLIQHTNVHDNGTYYCQAENKAARSISNFTLHVTDSVDTPTILQLRLEYFIAVAVAVIVILIVVLIVVAVLLIRVCKNRLGSGSVQSDKMAAVTSINGSVTTLQQTYTNGHSSTGNLAKVAPVPAKMPKHIQMGTGFRSTTTPLTSNGSPKQLQPDLLTDTAHNVSRNSVTTTTTSTGATSKKAGSSTGASSNASQGSYRMAMENIIEDYSRHSGPQSTPLICENPPATTSTTTSSVMSPNHLTSTSSLQMQRELPLLTPISHQPAYPSDFGLPLRGNQHLITASLPRAGGGGVGGGPNYMYDSLLANHHLYQQQQKHHPSLQPSLFPSSQHSRQMLPDEQYPILQPERVMTLPFHQRNPYIHTASSGPASMLYYQDHMKSLPTTTSGTAAVMPIYESIGNPTSLSPITTENQRGDEKDQRPGDIYSRVNKPAKTKTEGGNEDATSSAITMKDGGHLISKGGEEKPSNCDDNGALERLTLLLTSPTEQQTQDGESNCDSLQEMITSTACLSNNGNSTLSDVMSSLSSGDNSNNNVTIGAKFGHSAPMATAENSLAESSEDNEPTAAKTVSATISIYQELDDAFTSLDQEIQHIDEEAKSADQENGPALMVVSAPTAI